MAGKIFPPPRNQLFNFTLGFRQQRVLSDEDLRGEEHNQERLPSAVELGSASSEACPSHHHSSHTQDTLGSK